MPRTSVLAHARHITPDTGNRDHADLARLAELPDDGADLILLLPDGTQLAVEAKLVTALRATADELLAGHGVTILATETLLSPNDVAGLLGLSRPFVARLLDEGKIASQQLAEGSSHRVVRLSDVEQFKARRERRAEGRRKLAEAAAEAGIEY
ncbi:MAG: helix-turn-helix domain-containing protein [Catenulispora sp.]